MLSISQELIVSRRNGRERLNRVEALAAEVGEQTAASGREALARELDALRTDWQQWEESTLQAQSGLETMLSQTTSSEQEFQAQVAQLDKDLTEFKASLTACSHSLSQLQDKTTDEELVECWQKAKETEEALKEAESMSESLKGQLNDLCRFSKDLSSHSDKVSSLIKEYNSLCLQTAKYCQNKERALEQRFRTTFREFQQWMINTKITTCFDTPQNIDEATAIIQKLQDFLSESEACQSKLNTLISKGELLGRILSKDKAEAIQTKVSTAKEDWKNLLTSLHRKEAALQNLQSQMKDFEAGVGPVQEWLIATEAAVQGSNSQLPDLVAKKNEQFRLQSVLEDITYREPQLNKLKEKAQHLWEDQASNKSFMHRVSQLSAWYLALSNLAKEKTLRAQRTVSEHQQFSQGLKELQDWLADARHMLESYCAPTADKNLLDSRMAKVEALLALRQEKEIQLKMVLTRGESVLRSTSPEGTVAIRQQMAGLKDSWDSLLSFSIQCKSQLEGALSQWTSYQDDVRQFMSWMDRMEGDLKASERQCTELRDKATALGKAKLLYEDTRSHSRLLETIQAKGESMAQHYVSRLELQELQERFSNLSEKAKEGTRKAEEQLLLHQEYQLGLKSFEEWLEQEKENLCCCSHLGNDVETLESTLRDLEDLEKHCTEGQTLMSAVLQSQEKMTLSGSTYMEDRILESAQRDWHLYQRRLAETKEKVNATLSMLRKLEKMFQQVDVWLSDLEGKVNIRTGRKSDRDTKQTQLQQLQKWNEEILARKDEVERVGLLAHQVLEESHINSSVGSQATHLAARYQGILLHVVDQTKLLKEELRALEEADLALGTYTDWLRATQKNFKNMAVALNVVDKTAMENKIKKFETLHNDIDMGNSLLKMILEKSERAIEYLEGPEAQGLRESMDGHIGQLNELTSSIRRERGNLEKCLYLTKEFLDKYQSQTKWLAEYQAILQIPVEPKVELFEKKAQLAKYKAIQQTIVSHEPGIKLVIEKGQAVFELIHDPAVSDNLKRLQTDYQELRSTVMVCVQNLGEKVREHEDYNSNLQEVEKWLLQISTRLVAPDTTQSTNLEMATQHLARHKPIMEEIAGFEHALASLRSKGDSLVANCSEGLQGKFKHQVQGHLQGIRDSYSAICSTAQRLYQSLERELQKHVSHQDTLQQCQAWLHSVQQELKPRDHPPTSPRKSLKQVKHYRALQEQASTYLELLCSMCDLSDDTVKIAAADIQHTKQAIEQRLVRSQELALGWEEVKRQKAELGACFLETEQQLHSLKRRPAELELKIAQKQVAQVQELGRHFQSRQANITALTEKVSALTEGQESPEHSEIGQLSNQWLELCHQINALLSLSEEDQQRARDYHDRVSVVEVLLDKFTKEWDNLARTDAESTAEHLEALRKLAGEVQAQRFVLDDLKEQKQMLMDRLDPEDKELIKEQSSHLERQWVQLEGLIEKKIQLSARVLEELSQCQARLDDLLEWAEAQAQLFGEALRCSPPAELAQTLLPDHIAVCNELESQELAHGALTEEAERILAQLGLDERQQLQRALSALHGRMGSLHEAVGQRRKYLSQALSDRTQFLMAVGLASSWVQQNRLVATSKEPAALMPAEVGKQIRSCKSVGSRLKEYQTDVAALWAQGRELAKEATEEETSEIMAQLQELQATYDSALQEGAQRLQELEKVLLSRKYFKADLDRVCQWMKQADVVTFPQVSLMGGDAELSSQLARYRQVLEQSAEHENLLLLVQRAGRELLPSLSEADHSFLDEKLNALPRQFNSIVGLAKEKSEKIQEAMAARQEYASLVSLTGKALGELEEQLVRVSKARLSLSSEEAQSACSDCRALLDEVTGLGKAVDDLNQRKETFRSSGQPWMPDEVAGLSGLHSRLRRQAERQLALLGDTAEAYREHEACSLRLEARLRALAEELVRVNEETLSVEERLKNYHALAGTVQEVSSLLKGLIEQVEQFSPELDTGAREARSQQLQAWKEELQSAQGTISARIMECESRLVQTIDFQTEIQHSLDWLQQVKGDLSADLNLDVNLQGVQEEIRKSQILEEEVQSSLRIMVALSSKEKEKYSESRDLMPPEVESNLLELSRLEAEVQETLSSKKTSLDKAQTLVQQYLRAVQSARGWLDDASALLQQTGDGVDVEASEETLRRHVEFFATEAELASRLGELEALMPGFLPLINTAGREHVEQNLASLRQRRADTEQQAEAQQAVLQRCVTQWQDYQEARQQVIALMNQAEKRLSEFSSAKAATSHESEEKLTQHKSLLSVVNSFHEKITALEEQASHLESLGNDASKATISRSMTTVWQRWTRLRTVAREQEKMLEEAARGWKNLTDKIETTTVVVDQLQDRLPDSSVEKARKTELLELLEYHDAFAQEVEREQSTLTVLRQQALNMLRDVALPSTSVEDLPVMHEIKAMQDRYDNVRQKIRKSKKMVQQELKEREEVESELNAVKQWLHETREYLLNPTSDAVTELRELKELHTEVAARHQTVAQLGDRQRDKYLELYTILPSELSEQLAEVTLALGAIEEQVNLKEGEAQQMQAVTLDFNCRMQQISDELNDISKKLKEKGTDIVQAKIEHKRLWDKVDSCNVKLVELDATIQDFTEQNPHQSKCLTDDMIKLSSLYQQVFKETEYRASKLNKAASQLEEFHEMLEFVLKWLEKAKDLGYSAISWHCAAQLNDQLITYQATLRESEEIQSDLQAMGEKLDSVSDVHQTGAMSQRVANLHQQTDELQQLMRTRLQSLQDAAKDMEQFETEVKSLQVMVKQAQVTLTSPELARLCLKEQLFQRQRLLADMESFKHKVQVVHRYQAALRIPEEIVTNLPICLTALRLQEQASRLQHTAIQQCNILQEAVIQYEQCEQEMRHLQQLIDRAHREIQEKPVSTSNIQQLQAQISRHEAFAQKIKDYQEQIAALNTKCKMLTMKAKHATMLLTVTEVEGLSEGMEELDGESMAAHSAHPSVVMMTAGRCHTLLSPVTEESGEEGTNSELSSPTACRSPSPNADVSGNQDSAYYGADELQTAAPDSQDTSNAASLQEPLETTLGESASSKLDDLQRSWETLKNVISEKQRTLYEALERQQKYQDSVQSVSAKMESIEGKLGEALDASQSHDVQVAAHQALMEEIVTLQDEINELQICFAEELVSDTMDTDTSDQLAMQSTLTVLAERMATIKMKALGKKQLLEERLNEQEEQQRQEQALQVYRSEADELDNWLLITKAILDATLKVPKEQMDMDEQLNDCQNMLVEIERKVASVSELSMNSENLVLEGKPQTREQAEHLIEKLQNLKGSLVELQKMLQDRSISIKHGVVQEKEDTEIDFTFRPSPSVQEWLVQARASRYQHQQNSLQRQKELEQQLAEQKNLLRSVASSGEKIMTQQSNVEAGSEEQRAQATETAQPETLPLELGFEGEKLYGLQQLGAKWRNLLKEISSKQKLFEAALEQNQEQKQVYGVSSTVSSGMVLFKGEAQTLDKSVQTAKSLLTGLGQAFGEVTPQGKDAEEQSLPLEQKLYDAVSVTCRWLDGIEDHLLVSTSFLPEKAETHLYHEEALGKDIEEVIEEVNEKKDAFFHILPEPVNQDAIEETVSCLCERLGALGLTVKERCEKIKDQLQQLVEYQTELKLLITSLADSKYVVLQKLAEALGHTVTEQLQAILQAEDDLREFEARIGHLKERGEKLQPDQAILLDLSKVQDMYEELTMIIGSSRSSLNQSLALRGQYEQALQDLTDLTDTGQEKMSLDKRILVTSKEDVKNLLNKHKEFFQGLESHKILTETLCKKVNSCIHQKESSSQQELMTKCSALLKAAHGRGVELESVFETWTNLARDYEALYRQLEGVENSIPGAGLVEESEERLTERIALYQRLKASLTEHQPQLYQVLEDGRKLLMSVSCAELEAQVAQLGEHWLSSTTRVSRELHRLETVLKHWNRYQVEYTELNQWLQSAVERLEFWKLQSVTLPQELDAIRDHLSSFLEFSKEVDTKSSLKSSVLSRGNQLLRLKKVDTASLRSGLAQTDGQWTELLTQIPLVQERLHQLQMEKLPSRTAINELMNWISLMEQTLEEDDERIRSAVGSQMIEQYLKKYKAFKIDLACKQLTVDFVNQSVLQISSHDVESKRSDKTDFAERLGIMNRRWQLLQGHITEQIGSLETSRESWAEYENSVQCLKDWFESQEDQLKKWHSISDLASIHSALKDCQELEDIIRVKEKEVEKVEKSGLVLIQNKKEEASSNVMETLRELNHSWAHLDHLVGQLKITLQSLLDQWNIYKAAYEDINGHLMDARYSLSRFRLLTGCLEAVKIQVDNLQNLQEELDKSEGSLQKFDSVSNQLLKECHPPDNSLLTTNLNEVNTSWNNLLQDIAEQLHSSKILLQLWQKYRDYSGQCSVTVRQQEDKSNELIKKAANRDIAEEEVTNWIQDCDALLEELAKLRDSLHVLSDLGEEMRQQVDSSAAAAIQSDQLSLSQRLSTLEHALSRQRCVLQAGVRDYETFSKRLEALEEWIVEADEVLKSQDPNRSSDLTIIQDRMEELKVQMLRFSSTVPDLDRLNELGYRLPLNDKEIKRMQTLNRHWSSISAQTTERFSKLQAFLLQHQTFLEKCETWMEFLVQTEQTLAVEISGNYQNLLEQQRAHELFQTEMFSRQQILHSIISDGQRLLEQGQVDDRDEFNSKLAMLSNQWQGVIRRAQQRRGIIDSQVRQWQRYRELAEKLRKWLSDVSQQLEQRWGSAAPIALQQARSLLDEVQLKEKVLQRQQGSYILTVEAGKQLLLSADAEAEATLQAELTDIQEQWQAANIHLEEQRKQLNLLLKDWERCEKGIADSLAKLRSFKRKLSQPLPDHHDELHTEQIRCMELESSFGGWTDDLAHLSFLKETLSSYIRADDISLLQERIELLHRQWDELCHQVSLRRQLVTEKLNEWVLFNEKNKELCEWLTLMESKVSQNGDISIEEMIEKLKKDYQEEITAASENKMQLQQMGQRLMRASHESKASEIEYKLGKADDRWQHLLDLIGARVKKLKETLVAVQQLDKNMSSLRSWLAQIETELSKPIVYDSCDSQEIQHKLAEQQELQRDIEKHSTGVASVLNLCEVLLHDCDACATETECDSIQQATRNLDRRWRNICAMSMERRLKIEETWRLWQKFLDDYSRFEDWLETSERTAAMPNSSGVLYTVAKEELKKFEAFQRQVHESLTQLELINKQYRRLARENRTDSGSKLKDMVHEGNQRWDNLQRRVTAILRRLKHFIGQREEFETTRESILVWLTEMDLQLTNIEHFSECDVQAKIKQLKAFQQEIALNTSRIDQLFVDGEQLIEKSEPMDAAIIEEELEELHRYYQEVFGRVDRYYKKLMQLPLTDDEHEVSDRETEIDENSEFSSMQWLDRAADNVGTPPLSLSRGTGLPQPKDTRSGRDTPASVDSIPLEWDHDYDLSRNLESAVSRALEGAEDGTGDEDSDFYLKGAAEITDVVIPESPEAYLKLTESALRSTGEPGHLEKQIRQLDKALDSSRYHLQQTENAIRSKTPTGPELDSSYWGYMKLLSECRGSIETVKRVGHKLKEEEDKLSGLINLTSTESQTSGVIERWELIQAQALNKELRMKQNLQQWQQFNSDLDSIWQWLSETEEELEHLSKLDISTDIQTIELRIKKLKELQKAVDNHKAIILSINLCSAEFTQSDTSDVLELRERLSQMNKRWDQVGSMLEAWRHTLQDALMQCHDFHEMSHGLLLWLENIDRRRNEILPLDPNLDSDTLQDHHKTLLQIRRELLESQLKVASLQDMSSQLLVNAEGSDCLEAKEKVHVIGNRLKLLLKEVTQDLKELERILDNCGSQADLASWSSADDLDSSGSLSPVSGGSLAVRPRLPRGICSLTQPGASVSSPHSRLHKESQRDSSHSKELEARKKPSFLLRVLRAALPLQLLLLLLIALACLVPMTEEDYSCASSNNFARSFHPMLRYTNGPPPI